MYVNKAMLCVLESFILSSNICMFIAEKLSQIATNHANVPLCTILKNSVLAYICLRQRKKSLPLR